MRLFITILICVLQVTTCYAQDVSPDETTNTTVTDIPNQKINIKIAPKNTKGISHNKYTNFNVPLRGVDLDNQSVQAKTILNEVTSTNPTNIYGDLSVLGPKAHVIIANPNGINVDGGRFINTGGVALATSYVSFDTNNNLILNTNQGKIDIGPGGLSGMMTELDLIAKQIKINGAIENTNSDENSQIRLIAGLSTVKINSDQSVDATDGLWVEDQTVTAGSNNEFSIDISKTSRLASGAIRIRVNDAGAGVHLAGNLIASSGEFSLSSSGNVEIDSAHITAKQGLNVDGQKITIKSTERQTELTSEESGITLESFTDGISISGTKLTAVERNFLNFTSVNAITLQSAADINVKNENNFSSEFTTTIEGVSFLANGKIVSQNSIYSSAQDILLNSSKTLTTERDKLTAERDIQFISQDSASVLQTKLTAGGDVRIQAASLELVSGTQRAEILSTDGAITIQTTDGDLLNQGGLIEGFQQSLRDANSKGAVTLIVADNLRNESINLENLGVIFGRSGDVNIDVEGSVYNHTARLLSNADLSMELGGSFYNETPLTGTVTQEFIKKKGRRSWRSAWLKRDISYSYQTDYGSSVIDGEVAIVTAIGDIDIKAKSLVNKASQINGNNITLTVEDTLENSSVLSGKINFSQSCGLFSCGGQGTSNVDLLTSSITAAGLLTIISTNSVVNKGGRFNGGNGIKVDSNRFQSESIFVPTVVFRPQGLTGFFQGKYGWINTNFDGGFLSSTGGNVEIKTTEPIDLIGTGIFAVGDVLIDKQGNIVATPTLKAFANEPIGFLKRAY